MAFSLLNEIEKICSLNNHEYLAIKQLDHKIHKKLIENKGHILIKDLSPLIYKFMYSLPYADNRRRQSYIDLVFDIMIQHGLFQEDAEIVHANVEDITLSFINT